MPLGRRVQVSLTADQYLRLKSMAKKRDISISDLVRQAIDQAYLDDIDQELGTDDVRRLGDRRLLASEEEDIGVAGAHARADR